MSRGTAGIYNNGFSSVNIIDEPTLIDSTRAVSSAEDFFKKYEWSTELTSNSFASTFGVVIENTGSNSAGSTGHGAAIWGEAKDVSTSLHWLIGSEGKVTGKGAANQYDGVLAYTRFRGASRTGVTSGMRAKVEITGVDEVTPLAQGIAVSFIDETIIGGALKFTTLAENPLAGKYGIFAYDSGATKYTSISHDGTNGSIATSSGALSLAPASSNYIFTTTNALGILPLNDGIQAVGTTGFAFAEGTFKTALYVGDRSGTYCRINPDGTIDTFS